MTEREIYDGACELFRELLELDATARAARLAAARSAAPAVAQLAAGMLDAHLDAIGDGAADDPLGVIGRAIGPYRIEALIAAGGMGIVYRARQADPEVQVAVKFLRERHPTAIMVDRFEREARVLAGLDHEGIVRYIASSAEFGWPYLMMEFVPGVPLSPSLPCIAAGPRSTVAVIARVADAVAYMHRAVVLHRDLKPSNILWVAGDGESGGRPVLIDLGIARILDPDAERTVFAAPAGTEAYMSPEQWQPGATLDARTDVYGLGAVLFMLLTGSAPPSRSPRPATSAAQRSPNITDGERMLAAVPGVDADLNAIVAKALARDRDERYAAMTEFAADLRSWLGGRPVAARRPGLPRRLWKLARRHPLVASLGAALIASTAVAIAVFLLGVAREHRYVADLERQVRLSEQTLQFFTNEVFAEARPGARGPQTPILAVLQHGARTFVDGDDEHEPELTAAIGLGLTGVFVLLDDLDGAHEVATHALPRARQLARLDRWRIRFELEYLRLLQKRAELDEAARFGTAMWREIEAAAAAADRTDPELRRLRARLAQSLGTLAESTGRLDDATAWYQDGLALLGDGTDDRYERLRLRHGLALVLVQREQYGDAAVELERLLELADPDGDGITLEAFALHATLATVLRRADRVSRAVRHGDRAVAIAAAILPADHADRIVAGSNLFMALGAAGEFRRAAELAAEQLPSMARKNGAEADDLDWVVEQLTDFGAAHRFAAEDDDALAGLVATMAELRGADAAATARLRVLRAQAAIAAGASSTARGELERALRALPPADPTTVAARELARSLPATAGGR
ncbi:MAG: serine/threonine protein kinase [Planctomycetes bacterium]|nr:serine/threonine protein kinase [Planctomycetota bacterium]